MPKTNFDAFRTPFGDWVIKSGMSMRRIAGIVGVDSATIMRWCRGDNRPGTAHALSIMHLTDGKIGIEDWLTVAEIKALDASKEFGTD